MLIVGAASAGSAQSASHPISASNPYQAKAEHSADKASDAKPFLGATKVPLLPPQAKNTERGASAAQPPSHAASVGDPGFWHHWGEKFYDDPIVAFTFVLAISTVLLWFDTRGLRKLAKTQSKDTREALNIAKSAADAATKGALAAEATVATMQGTARRQLRAYVWKEIDAESLVNDNGRIAVESMIRNSGQTPARRVRCWAFLESLDASNPQFQKAPDEIKGAAFVINPGSTHTLHTSMLRTLDEGDTSDIAVGQKTIYLWGEIRYEDVFEVEQKTWFRLFHKVYERDGKKMQIWSYCDEGNDAT